METIILIFIIYVVYKIFFEIGNESDNSKVKIHKQSKTEDNVANSNAKEGTQIKKENNDSVLIQPSKFQINIVQSTEKRDRVTEKYDFFLYHFTDPSNIPSIKKYGLLSWYMLNLLKISHTPSSNDLSRELDERKGLQDYVRLALSKEHPMYSAAIYYGRVKSLTWLIINPTIIKKEGTLFSNTNATANYAIINNSPDTALKSNDVQAEVLIKTIVPPQYIIF